MPKFSEKSETVLSTCHSDIQRVMHEAIKFYDFSVLCGWRNKEEQEDAFRRKTSLLNWPNSRHNKSGNDMTRSDAVDCMPYPVEFPNRKTDTPKEYVRKMLRIYEMAYVILTAADRIGVDVAWGGMFMRIFDGPHFELKEG